MSIANSSQYTIQAAAKLAGISSRTLRHYDQIDLLKPSYRDPDTGYRYYRRAELLRLQQILFYRELGVSLASIRAILDDPQFEIAQALEQHRAELAQQIQQNQSLLKTIDRTLSSLKGQTMNDEEIFRGFDPEKRAQDEAELESILGPDASAAIATSRERTHNWRVGEFQSAAAEFDRLDTALCRALQEEVPVEATETQRLIGEHYALICRFWTPDAAAYEGLGQLYCNHAGFRTRFDRRDTRLAGYLAAAIRHFSRTL